MYLPQLCIVLTQDISFLLYRKIHCDLPEISEWPHLEMLDVRNFFTFGLTAILSRPSPAPRSGRIRLGFTRRGQVADIMAVDFFFVSFRARSASPSVPTRRFCYQRGLHTSHMKIFLASITLYSVWAGENYTLITKLGIQLIYSRCAPLAAGVT